MSAEKYLIRNLGAKSLLIALQRQYGIVRFLCHFQFALVLVENGVDGWSTCALRQPHDRLDEHSFEAMSSLMLPTSTPFLLHCLKELDPQTVRRVLNDIAGQYSTEEPGIVRPRPSGFNPMHMVSNPRIAFRSLSCLDD